MTTVSIHAKTTETGSYFRAWLDDTRTCPTCDGRGQMALRRSYSLMDIYFVRCQECHGSGISGSLTRIL